MWADQGDGGVDLHHREPAPCCGDSVSLAGVRLLSHPQHIELGLKRRPIDHGGKGCIVDAHLPIPVFTAHARGPNTVDNRGYSPIPVGFRHSWRLVPKRNPIGRGGRTSGALCAMVACCTPASQQTQACGPWPSRRSDLVLGARVPQRCDSQRRAARSRGGGRRLYAAHNSAVACDHVLVVDAGVATLRKPVYDLKPVTAADVRSRRRCRDCRQAHRW